jgi:hypothetical protein
MCDDCDGYCDIYDVCDDYCDIYDACDEYYEMYMLWFLGFLYVKIKKIKI